MQIVLKTQGLTLRRKLNSEEIIFSQLKNNYTKNDSTQLDSTRQFLPTDI